MKAWIMMLAAQSIILLLLPPKRNDDLSCYVIPSLMKEGRTGARITGPSFPHATIYKQSAHEDKQISNYLTHIS
jgi:hypothetical protein